MAASALLFGASLVSSTRAALADDTAEDLKQLRATVQKELADLKKREQKLHQDFLRLDQKSQVLDKQLHELQAAGAGRAGANPSAAVEGVAPPASADGSPKQAAMEVTQSSEPPAVVRRAPASRAPASAAPPAGGEAIPISGSPKPAALAVTQASEPAAPVQQAQESGAPPSPAPPAGGESAPISGPSPEQQRTKQILETASTLSNAGGVLTPKGQIVIDPSIEYDYWSQNQLGVNGFQVIPGVTFGNVNVTRFEQNIVTTAVTARYGVTDRLELNVKIPYVYASGSTSSLVPVGSTAQLLSVGAEGADIGDVQFGASYQINSGESGWPIFVGNLLFKTTTGVSPFDVPIITQSDPNGQFLAGTPKKLATGTGFYALTPSVTMLLPTAPGVLFANAQFQHNFAGAQPIQSLTGGPATMVNLQPGESPAFTFGIGFALNDQAALTLSYQQTYVFTAYSDGQPISGSAYAYGTFNFGLGYQISQSTRLNLSVGVGTTQNTPAAKVLLEIPYRFSL
jgi:hypothetical protein